MMWGVYIFIIFQCYYTSNGQIVLVPSSNITTNPKHLLSGKEEEGSARTLRARRPDGDPLPSQWALGPEGSARWPNGRIDYYVDSDSYGAGIAGRVESALERIGVSGSVYSCPQGNRLTNKPTQAAGSWLHFTNPNRVRPCVHDAGRDKNGEIQIVLGYDCLKIRDIIHTILHGLGFRDEITHPQRDLFVRVQWENIQPAFRSMFRVQPVGNSDAALMEYDPKSVMHFHDRAYSVNGWPTILPMVPGLGIEPSLLSHLDKMKISRLFGHECKKRQIGNVIGNACAAWHTELQDENGNNDQNANGCRPGDTNDVKQIVIPGDDVKIEPDQADEDDNDSKIVSNNDGSGNQLVVPGKDVKIAQDNDEDDIESKTVSNNDVKADNDESVSDNDVADDNTKTNSNKKILKLEAKVPAPDSQDIPDTEAIVVGYQLE